MKKSLQKEIEAGKIITVLASVMVATVLAVAVMVAKFGVINLM